MKYRIKKMVYHLCYPWWLPVIMLVLATLLTMSCSDLLAMLFQRRISIYTLLLLTSLVQCAVFVGLTLGLSAYGGGSFRRLRVTPSFQWQMPAQGLAYGVILHLLVTVVTVVTTLLLPFLPMDNSNTQLISGANTMWSIGALVLCTVVLAPVGEELFFRVLMFEGFNRRFGSTVGMIATSVIFAALHFDLSGLIPIFVAAMFLNRLYCQKRNIYLNMLVHGTFNGISVLLGLLFV